MFSKWTHEINPGGCRFTSNLTAWMLSQSASDIRAAVFSLKSSAAATCRLRVWRMISRAVARCFSGEASLTDMTANHPLVWATARSQHTSASQPACRTADTTLLPPKAFMALTSAVPVTASEFLIRSASLA